MKAKIKSFATKVLEKLELTPDSIEITKDDQDTYHLNLKLDDQETGILIGYHGDTISALQLILGLMLYKQSGSWTRLVVNVGDYREKREESLQSLAQDTASRVLQNGEPIALFNLSPFERRTIHMFLKENPDINTESQGEGKNRHLIVSSATDIVPPPTEEPELEASTSKDE